MGEDVAIAAFSSREGRKELRNAVAEINRKTEDGAKLNNDGEHLPIAISEIDAKQGFGYAKVCGGADRQKFGESFDDAEDERKQVLIQKSSGPQTGTVRPGGSVDVVPNGGYVLLNHIYQTLRACGPVGVGVFGNELL